MTNDEARMTNEITNLKFQPARRDARLFEH